MGVKIRTEIDEFPSMEKSVEALKGKKVKVGVLKGENAWLASIHEYGCTIPVTPKMRAFLHRKGLHLKKTTTVIVIPERSFLRAGFDENRDKVMKSAERTLPLVLDGKMSPDAYCKEVGLMLSSAIREYAVNLSSPANHPFTVDQKGSSNPLVDSGDMIGGIDYEVEG